MQTTTSETHKDIFPPAIVPCKVQPMLPQIVVRRAFGLYVDKVRAARARVARGSDAQGQVSVVRHVVRELAEQRRAELSKGIYERKKRGKGEGALRCVAFANLVAKTGVTAADALFVAWTNGETHVSVE